VENHQKRIGQRIARAREAKGWTQHQLADALGINDTQISRYENGRHTPKPRRYEALANALEVPAETFFYDPPS
jgi:transcriptional regulator with XRE-family HTH domain